MITRRGIGFVLAAIAAFFIASATRVGWVHLADAVLWGIILLSAITPWLSVYGISVSRRLNVRESAGLPGVTEGSAVKFTHKLQNRWWLPRFLLNVTFEVESSRDSRTNSSIFLGVLPGKDSTLDSEISVNHRGLHSLSRVRVESRGLFGLFRRTRTFAKEESVLVYPAFERINQVGILNSTVGNFEGVSKARTGVEIAGTRRYVAGDPYRSIHWRNSARTGRLAVKEFDAWSERSLTMVIDVDTPSDVATTNEFPSDYAARLALTSAIPMLEAGGTVRLASEAAGQFRTSFADFATDVALLEDCPAGTSERFVESIGAGERVLAFVHEHNTRLKNSLASLGNSGVEVSVVLLTGFVESSGESFNSSGVAPTSMNSIVVRKGELAAAYRALESGAQTAPDLRLVPDRTVIDEDDHMETAA